MSEQEISTDSVEGDFKISLADSLSLVVKEKEREEIGRQIEAFLSSGGKIDQVEPNVLADPPKKPTSNYGSQPI